MFEQDHCPGCGAQGTLQFRGQPRYGGGGRFPQRAQVVCRRSSCYWRGSMLDVRHEQEYIAGGKLPGDGREDPGQAGDCPGANAQDASTR